MPISNAAIAVPNSQLDVEIESLKAENAELRRKLEAAEVFETMFKAQRDKLLQTPTPQAHVKPDLDVFARLLNGYINAIAMLGFDDKPYVMALIEEVKAALSNGSPSPQTQTQPAAYTSKNNLDRLREQPSRNSVMWGEPLPHHEDVPLYLHPPTPQEHVEALEAIRRLSSLDDAIGGASAVIMSRMADIHQHADAALALTPAPAPHLRSDDEPVAWFMHLWNEADEDVKSDVRWGRPSGDDIERAEHNGHDIEYLYSRPAPAPVSKREGI
jgi:hypothetical protein